MACAYLSSVGMQNSSQQRLVDKNKPGVKKSTLKFPEPNNARINY
jgi:hypothetical protein